MRNHDWGRQALLPLPAISLYRELCSCALDAELARLTGHWDIGLRAKHAGLHMQERTDNTPVSRKFRHVRNGGRFKDNHVERLLAAYPSRRLAACQEHRLARVLCDTRLNRETLVNWLYELPHGRVRRTLFDDGLTIFSGFRHASRRRWDARSIQSLIEIGSPASLYALACRMRVAQMEGDTHFDELEEDAVWMVLPAAIGRSTSLLLGSYALVRAVDFFLSWQPFSEMRNGFDEPRECIVIREEALLKLNFLREKATVSERIPASELKHREARSTSLELP